MKQRHIPIVPLLFILIMHHGCATVPVHEVSPTQMNHAQEEIPEDSLLDVGRLVFKPGELSREDEEQEGTNAEIRKADSHFLPVLRHNTLQRSSSEDHQPPDTPSSHLLRDHAPSFSS